MKFISIVVLRIIRAFRIITVRFKWSAPFAVDSGGQPAIFPHYSTLLVTDRWRSQAETLTKYVLMYSVYSNHMTEKPSN